MKTSKYYGVYQDLLWIEKQDLSKLFIVADNIDKDTQIIGYYLNISGSYVITMPCGHKFDISEINMLQDLPCTCGNPNHWFYKTRKNEM